MPQAKQRCGTCTRRFATPAARCWTSPTEYGGKPGYGKQYYAVFFADPDGVKLEVCFVRGANP
jgi:hypothetical protein